ncbi:hypothetical protein [Rickettsia australis]|uniref:Uncharacterized protein n=1 Tax=Rickettsia australis (strain Cutlack) TaxID=1105110 RepID=H8K8Y6_RICAC|nr:hypothetical protein [Rickettsia australis]AFC70506.1 hypothetical protein MC5_00390 [Rickettsia australis str. Cutlack]
MAQYNQNNRGNRTNLINTGNLEFTNRDKVKFNKDYAGTITTSKANIGEVTFMNIPNIYEVGAVNKRIEKLAFMDNHVHNLHKNIYAAQVNFDAGTYNVHTNPAPINGNAKINGSTFDLKCDLIFNSDVEFSGNITFNVTGGYSVFFQNNLSSVIADTNIIINITVLILQMQYQYYLFLGLMAVHLFLKGIIIIRLQEL